VRTLGIDLAAQPANTSACAIEWGPAQPVVSDLRSGLDDEALLDAISHADKVGIDAPFGWPLAFIDAITTYRDHGAWLELAPNDLRFRATETVVAEVTGQAPLSVAISDLAWPAMRLAQLLTTVGHVRGTVDRTGEGWAAEVYPAAALRRWEIIAMGTSVSAASYKGDKPGRDERRQAYMETLRSRLDRQVDIDPDTYARCVADDDDLDAFVSALIARAVQRGLCDPIPATLRWAAVREGWIHLPTTESLDNLAD
jgi:predicted nuclease with RNAse H fold